MNAAFISGAQASAQALNIHPTLRALGESAILALTNPSAGFTAANAGRANDYTPIVTNIAFKDSKDSGVSLV